MSPQRLEAEDFEFAEAAVRLGALSLSSLYQVMRDFTNSRLVDEAGAGERLGPYLVRTGSLDIQQLYAIAMSVPRRPESKGEAVQEASRAARPAATRGDGPRVFALILYGLEDPTIKDAAVRTLVKVADLSESQAWHRCRGPLSPVLTRMTRAEADGAKRLFLRADVPCRLIRWRKRSATETRQESSRHRRRPTSRRSPRVFRVEDLASDDRGRPQGESGDAANPFAMPVVERPPGRDPLSKSGSRTLESVVGALGDDDSMRGVIFTDLDDDGTASAPTKLSASASLRAAEGTEARPLEPPPPRTRSSKIGLGSLVGGFRLLKLLGKGGFAKVYLGEHALLGHKAAVKVYSAWDSKLMRRITRREATLITHIRHPRVVSVLNVGREGRSFFVVMEYVAGRSASQQLRHVGELPLSAVERLARDAAAGLHHLHLNGLVHRDVKPSNILVEPNGRARILDFELIKSFEDPPVEGEEITGPGQMVGTPRFLSPEQIDNAQALRPASDIFSLGATLYYLLTGVHAFKGQSLIQVVKQVLVGEPRAMKELRPDAPDELVALVGAMLAKAPEDRPASMAEVLDRLDAVPWPTRKTRRRSRTSPSIEARLMSRVPTDTARLAGVELAELNTAGELEDTALSAVVPGAEDLESDVDSTILPAVYRDDDDQTAIAPPLPLAEERDPVVHAARSWEDYQSGDADEAEAFLVALAPAIRASPALSPAREWLAYRCADELFLLSGERYAAGEISEAARGLRLALRCLPEHRAAAAFLEAVRLPLEVDFERVLERARAGRPQLWPGLAAALTDGLSPQGLERVRAVLGLGDGPFAEAMIDAALKLGESRLRGQLEKALGAEELGAVLRAAEAEGTGAGEVGADSVDSSSRLRALFQALGFRLRTGARLPGGG